MAESPSTMYSSRTEASRLRQSANLATRLAMSSWLDMVFLMDWRVFSACSRLCLLMSTCWQSFWASSGFFQKVDFQLVLEEVRHGLGHKLVVNGLLGLVFVAGTGGEAGGNEDQAVLHIGECDLAFAFFLQVLGLQIGVDLAHKGRSHRLVRAAAVFQPAGVVVVFQQLHLVGKSRRPRSSSPCSPAGRPGRGRRRCSRRTPRGVRPSSPAISPAHSPECRSHSRRFFGGLGAGYLPQNQHVSLMLTITELHHIP